jgi:hypothetical protein
VGELSGVRVHGRGRPDRGPATRDGVVGYDEGFRRSWRLEGAHLIGAIDGDFVRRRRERDTLQVVAGETGALRRERPFGDTAWGHTARRTFATRETVVVEPSVDRPLLALDKRTLETRWERPASFDVVGSADSIGVLGSAPERETEVTVLDASTGRETFRAVVPGEPSFASALFLAGRLFVITPAGPFCFDG